MAKQCINNVVDNFANILREFPEDLSFHKPDLLDKLKNELYKCVKNNKKPKDSSVYDHKLQNRDLTRKEQKIINKIKLRNGMLEGRCGIVNKNRN